MYCNGTCSGLFVSLKMRNRYLSEDDSFRRNREIANEYICHSTKDPVLSLVFIRGARELYSLLLCPTATQPPSQPPCHLRLLLPSPQPVSSSAILCVRDALSGPGRGSGGIEKCRGAGGRIFATPRKHRWRPWRPCPPRRFSIPRRPGRAASSPAPGRGSGGFENCRGAGGRLFATPR